MLNAIQSRQFTQNQSPAFGTKASVANLDMLLGRNKDMPICCRIQNTFIREIPTVAAYVIGASTGNPAGGPIAAFLVKGIKDVYGVYRRGENIRKGEQERFMSDLNIFKIYDSIYNICEKIAHKFKQKSS